MGKGRITRVPYVCALPPGQKVINGQYIAMCFGRRGEGAVLGFASSTSAVGTVGLVKRNREASDFIDVDSDRSRTKFNDTFFNPLEIHRGQFNEKECIAHLVDSVKRCLEFHGIEKLEEPFSSAGLKIFEEAAERCGFQATRDLQKRFIQALVAKPFVILTGNSGTGKTKLAELFAGWLVGTNSEAVTLVAVGADWTDNRNVFGFVNYLRQGKDPDGVNCPIYQSTAALDLLLHAKDSPLPHFLILDEMNLSHVERYFADFLSALEALEGEIHLHRENVDLPRQTKGAADVPELLDLPDNLFVIGTVNVDETTYMFSPKVLDRANVIEFRVDHEDFKYFLETGESGISDIELAPKGYAQAFLDLARRARSTPRPNLDLFKNDDPPADATGNIEAIKRALQEIFDLLSANRREFGYRIVNEVLRYAAVDYELAVNRAEWDWRSCMDAQIMQKILPKLHGSRRQIETLLIRLARYCERSEVPEDDNTPAHLQPNLFKPIDDASFKISYRKLCDMIDAVRRDQFVSFIQ